MKLQGIFLKFMLAYFLYNCLIPETKKINTGDILCHILHCYGMLLPQFLFHQRRINTRHSMLDYPVSSQHYISLL